MNYPATGYHHITARRTRYTPSGARLTIDGMLLSIEKCMQSKTYRLIWSSDRTRVCL